jgi:ribonuclease HI
MLLGFPLFKDAAEAALRRGEELVEFEVPNTPRSWPPFGVLGMPPRRFVRIGQPRPPGQELKVCKKFVPPQTTDTPRMLFSHQSGNLRFSREVDGKWEALLYADGACLENGAQDARGGYAFVFQPENPTQPVGHNFVSHPLEQKGPTGLATPHTSNRAELRAVLAALRFRAWQGEGWERLVIATDSAYVVNGLTEYMETWLSRGWLNSRGRPVANRDLWEALLERIREFDMYKLDLAFWQIPRGLNGAADSAAKLGALLPPDDEYHIVEGIQV